MSADLAGQEDDGETSEDPSRKRGAPAKSASVRRAMAKNEAIGTLNGEVFVLVEAKFSASPWTKLAKLLTTTELRSIGYDTNTEIRKVSRFLSGEFGARTAKSRCIRRPVIRIVLAHCVDDDHREVETARITLLYQAVEGPDASLSDAADSTSTPRRTVAELTAMLGKQDAQIEELKAAKADLEVTNDQLAEELCVVRARLATTPKARSATLPPRARTAPDETLSTYFVGPPTNTLGEVRKPRSRTVIPRRFVGESPWTTGVGVATVPHPLRLDLADTLTFSISRMADPLAPIRADRGRPIITPPSMPHQLWTPRTAHEHVRPGRRSFVQSGTSRRDQIIKDLLLTLTICIVVMVVGLAIWLAINIDSASAAPSPAPTGRISTGNAGGEACTDTHPGSVRACLPMS